MWWNLFKTRRIKTLLANYECGMGEENKRTTDKKQNVVSTNCISNL